MTSLLALTLLAPAKGFGLTNGKTLDLSKEKAVLAIAFAVDCPHTRTQMPNINKLMMELQGQVTVVGVVEKDMKGAKAFVKSLKPNFPVVADKDGKFADLIGAQHSLDFAAVVKGKPEFKSDGLSQDRIREALKLLKAEDYTLAFLPKTLASGCSIH